MNGAIFLDESYSLLARPYTYILYGHNMKTEAMFCCLRRHEDSAFYHSNPFITFDTANEAGRYVVFSVATLSTDRYALSYADLNRLNSTTVLWREEIISLLQRRSMYSPVIDVDAGDQVLLLVSCKAEEGNERRVIAARHIREDESEPALMNMIRLSGRQR